MKRSTKRNLSTVIGCVLGGVTFTGPLAGEWLSDYQCRRGLCPHSWHRNRYTPTEAADRAAIAYLRNRGVTVSPSVDPEEPTGCSSPYHCPCGCGAHVGCFFDEPASVAPEEEP